MNEDTIDIEARKPIIDSESAQAYPPDEIDRQWRLVTEATRRGLINDQSTRRTLLQFCTTPVTETLPGQFLQTTLASDQLIARLAERYRLGIKQYLELPAVPDELIKPDIRNAPTLLNPHKLIEDLRRLYRGDDAQFERSLRNKIESGAFLRGITAEERLMIVQRYRYARDVKLLALGAEIIDQGDVTLDENGEVLLPSGVRAVTDLDNSDQRADLLSPHLWERRRQLKDRVYEIFVNGRKYILKERKTARHTDTKKGGHKEGRLSSEEFEIAKHFQENGNATRGGVSVSWERPIGYVSYPDGFSFAVFEYEEGFIEGRFTTSRLTKEILDHKDQFLDEYQLIVQLVDKYKDSPEVLSFDDRRSESGLRALARWLGLHKDTPPQLSFEEFAMVKALRMKRQASNLLEETIIKNGYNNSDIDGYSYRIKEGNQLQLEIVGFDFEYFSKMSPDEIPEELERYKQYEKEDESGHGIGFLYWDGGSSVTQMQRAAYFAMLESEGILDKGVEH